MDVSSSSPISRRNVMTSAGLGMTYLMAAQTAPWVRKPGLRAATFSVDVTPPLGHPCMAGGIAPVKEVLEPLFANGVVLVGSGDPIVLLSVDWCEIRNDAYDRWRACLANAVGTTPEKVLVSSTHVHDAPVADLEAERILRKYGAKSSICDLDFHERCVQLASIAARHALTKLKFVTRISIGKAIVEQIASNRRYILPTGQVAFDRTSSTRNVLAQQGEIGVIDPWIRTIGLWADQSQVAELSSYATHPMSYYGKGSVSSDFIGLARWRRIQADLSVAQIYFSGCAGDVTAGKFNDGSAPQRSALADRLFTAMDRAHQEARSFESRRLEFRCEKVALKPRSDHGFRVEDSLKVLTDLNETNGFKQNLAAMNLSWRKRCESGLKIDVPMIDFGAAQFLLLPAESYVEFQLYASRLEENGHVIVAGYGECAPGYIPTDYAWVEGDTNLRDWCWVSTGAEGNLKGAIRAVMA